MHISCKKFDETVKKIAVQQEGRNFVLATLNSMSYIISADLHYNSCVKSNILIGKYTMIAHDVVFEIGQNHALHEVTAYPFDHVLKMENMFLHRAPFNQQQLIIGNDVWIGSGVRFVKAVKVGNGAIIGGGAVVTKDVPPYAIVGGNPARILRYRFDAATIQKLQYIKWWNWPLAVIRERYGLLKDPAEFVDTFFSPRLLAPLDTPVTRQLQEKKEAGCTLIYFVPDLASDDAVWRNVISQYLDAYTADDAVMLLVEISSAPEGDDSLCELQAMVRERLGHPEVVYLKNRSAFSMEAIQNADYYVTTKEGVATECIDYLDNYGGSVLIGTAYDVFGTVRLRRKFISEAGTEAEAGNRTAGND